MITYTVRVDNLCETEITRDDNGVTIIDLRDRYQHTRIELPDVNGPDLLITLANQCIRVVDRLRYGHELATPERLAIGGGEG